MTGSSVQDTGDRTFNVVEQCWICGGDSFERLHEALLDFTNFAGQDPGLHSYTGQTVWFQCCDTCGFTQPEALPALPSFFDRIYDQRWGEDWLDREFNSTYKDFIFRTVLDGLRRRLPPSRCRLLDVGAHVGKLIYLAGQAGWMADGVELNPRAAAFAARRSGRNVHQINAHALADQGCRYDAVTLIDVLEHIPEPLEILNAMRRLIEPGGWIVLQVPCGPSQLSKERLVRLLRRRPYLNMATNLVHVNHFDSRSLGRALESAGFSDVAVSVAPPVLAPHRSRLRSWGSRLARLGCYHVAHCLPGGVHTPLAFNLQAFGRTLA